MTELQQLIAETARSLCRYEDRAPRPAIVAAVSGGVDSTVLARVLAALFEAGRLPGGLVLAHIDHGVRPDSAAAAAAVVALARRLRLLCAVRRLDLGAGENPSEDAMRRARYLALAECAEDVGAGILVTAHHADDDLETILFRMMRGTGPRGLAGIPEFRRTEDGLCIVRPFLRTRRRTLERVLTALGEHALEDETNEDRRKSRNFIRHEIIPGLRARLGDRLEASLFAVGRSARALCELREARATRLCAERATQVADWRVELTLRGLGPADRPFLDEVLRALCLRIGGPAPSQHWLDRAVGLCDLPAGRRVAAFGSLLLERTRQGLLLVDLRRAGEPADGAVDLDLDRGVTRFGDTEWRVRAVHHGAPPLWPGPAAAGRFRGLLDLDRAPWPWRMRRPRPGERFQPLGAPAPLDLRRFLQRRAVPRYDRARLPVVVDARDDVLWVPGADIAAFARLRPASDNCVELSCRDA